MKALILNSGKGSRMGDLTKTHPKCMTEIASMETIISRQLRQVAEQGISEVIITTGPFEADSLCGKSWAPLKLYLCAESQLREHQLHLFHVFGEKVSGRHGYFAYARRFGGGKRCVFLLLRNRRFLDGGK